MNSLNTAAILKSSLKTIFNEVFQQVKSVINTETELADRQIRHIALLLTPVKLLQGKLTFPFDLDMYQDAVIENAKMQDEMAKRLKGCIHLLECHCL